MAQDYGLLIAATVAIVAVVGLVTLFSGQATGMTIDPGQIQCPQGYIIDKIVSAHGQVSYVVCKDDFATRYPGIAPGLLR